jgi:hypothetical protein
VSGSAASLTMALCLSELVASLIVEQQTRSTFDQCPLGCERAGNDGVPRRLSRHDKSIGFDCPRSARAESATYLQANLAGFMFEENNEALDHQFDRLERKMPASVGQIIRRLREPSARWVRIPIGILFVIGGVFSFLPILGLWMIPLGLLLLAQDVPFLRRPTERMLVWSERKWNAWTSKWESWTRRRRSR